MKLIIHDLKPQEFEKFSIGNNKNTIIISEKGYIHPCKGCFGCWIKTPGVCVIKDGYNNMGELLAKCSELVIISKCKYGSYSPFIRNIFDRSIPYLLPYFVSINRETHHKNRYKNGIDLFSAYFYGDDISKSEKETARALVTANSTNFYVSKSKTYFYKNIQEICEVIS